MLKLESFKNEPAFWIMHTENYLLSSMCPLLGAEDTCPQILLHNLFFLRLVDGLFLFRIPQIGMWQEGGRGVADGHTQETAKCNGQVLGSVFHLPGFKSWIPSLWAALTLTQCASVPLCKLGIIVLVNSEDHLMFCEVMLNKIWLSQCNMILAFPANYTS